MMQFFGIRASMSGDPSRLAAFGQDVEWIANRVFIPGSLLAFASGILLVVESDFYGFGDDWIVIGLALYATTFFAGLLFLGPEAGRIGEPMEECSPDAILWGLAGAAVAAGLVYWRYRVALSQPSPGRPAADL
jgi:hypothetical protein